MGLLLFKGKRGAGEIIPSGSATLDPRVTFTRLSNGTLFNSVGTNVTAADNVARFDFNPTTLQPRGFLSEGARTNSLRNSAFTAGSITNTALNNSAASVSGSVVGSGTTNGLNWVDIRVTGTASASSGIAARFETNTPPIVAASGQTWATSLYIALVAGTVPNGALNLSVEGVTAPSTRVESSGTNIVSSLTTTLQRFSHVRTLNNAGTDRVNGYLEFGFNNGAVVDFTLRIAATHLEQGFFPTSFISTDGAAATRALDNATISTLSSIGFNATEGTFLVEFENPYAFVSGFSNRQIFGFGTDANNFTRVLLDTTGAIRMASTTAGTLDVNVSDGGGARNAGTFRTAFAYKQNDFAICTNGATVVTDTTALVPPSTQLTIGQSIVNAEHLFGYIRRLIYYPSRLPNATLQSLTA